MEVKTAAWGAVALVITAFGAVVIYAIEREGIKNDLAKARTGMNAEQAMLDSRKKTLADRNEAYAALQDRLSAIETSTQRIKAREEKNGAILQEIEMLRRNWTKTRLAFAAEIEVVRQQIRDETVPEMALGDGEILKSVRFKEMKDSTVILEHTSGIAKVPLANMPADWIGRLALGWNPKLTAELSGKPDAPEPEAAPVATSKTAEMVQQEQRESVKRADVTDAKGKIRTLERKIAEAHRSRTNQLEVARQYAYKHQLALSKGNSSSHGVKRDEATRQAAALENQINAAQAQIIKLQEEIVSKGSGAF